MSQDNQALDNASPEVREIIKEMEAESAPAPEAKTETVETKEEVKPEAKPEEKAEAQDKPEPDENKNKVERTSKYVPVSKHVEERHKRQEAETRAEKAEREAAELRAKLDAASNKPAGEANDDLANLGKSLAEKHDLDPGFVNDLLEGVSKLTSRQQKDLPPELKADLEAIKAARAEAEAQQRQAAEDKHFDSEFDSIVKEFPELASRKEALKELAFSEENINTKLRTLAIAYKHDNPEAPGRKTMETPGGSRNGTRVIDYKEMTEDQLASLSGEEIDKYAEWLRKNPKG
jgi:hypothetical protein